MKRIFTRPSFFNSRLAIGAMTTDPGCVEKVANVLQPLRLWIGHEYLLKSDR
jgi:hypothetical protein